MKNSFFQELRGLCIIAVVFIHLPLPDASIDLQSYWIVFRNLINFPVAIFIFLSAYFVNQNETIFTKEWFRKRLKRLLFPYLIWTTFYLIIAFFTKGLSFKFVMSSFLLGTAAAPFYYIIVLIQLVILTPFLLSILKRKSNALNIFLLSITPIWIIIIYLYAFYTHSHLPLYHRLFPAWLSFYYWGLLYKHNELENNIKEKNPINLLLLLLVSLMYSVFESFFIIRTTSVIPFAVSQLKLSSLFYTSVLLMLLLSLKRNYFGKTSFLKKIGDNSFGIFFLHMLILKILIILMNFIPVIRHFFIIEQFLLGVMTLLICSQFIKFAKKKIPSSILKILGLN